MQKQYHPIQLGVALFDFGIYDVITTQFSPRDRPWVIIYFHHGRPMIIE